MSLDLSPLFERAFLTTEALRATEALAGARAEIEAGQSARAHNYQVVVPEGADAGWFEETFLRRFVYYCESTRAPLPACAGVFVSFFAGDRLCCVAGFEVIGFACEVLGVGADDLVRRFGTGEVRHALRGDG